MINLKAHSKSKSSLPNTITTYQISKNKFSRNSNVLPFLIFLFYHIRIIADFPSIDSIKFLMT